MPKRGRLSEQDKAQILFPVCEKFLTQQRSGAEIVAEIEREFGVGLSREEIYPLLREGVRCGYIQLCPPADLRLAELVAERYKLDKDRIKVVDAPSATALHSLAVAAADLALQVVHEVAKRKKDVHLGLGSGRTTQAVAQLLAAKLRAEGGLASLTVHALTAGFAVERPEFAPVSLFNFFSEAAVQVNYVGLFAAALVPVDQYEEQKKLPGVDKAFADRKEIDIVLTSLAWADDKHGRYTQMAGLGGEAGADVRELIDAGWLGDVQYRPFGANGPIQVTKGTRPVSLFEIPDFVQLAQTEGKHVILIAGPCGYCQERKTKALRPLLARADLKVWDWLVIDLLTAKELLTQE